MLAVMPVPHAFGLFGQVERFDDEGVWRDGGVRATKFLKGQQGDRLSATPHDGLFNQPAIQHLEDKRSKQVTMRACPCQGEHEDI